MSSVSKKRETSKKKPADLRLLAKAEREDRGEVAVTAGIHRAAERAGITPTESAEQAAYARALLDLGYPVGSPHWAGDTKARKAFDELTALRQLADAVEEIFDAEGIHDKTPAKILEEALRCTKADISLLSDGAASGLGVDGMHFRRAEDRIDLALALAEYRATFGRVSP
jgi:hypothetical protein